MARLFLFVCVSAAVVLASAHEHFEDEEDYGKDGKTPNVEVTPPHVPGDVLSLRGPPKWTWTKGEFGPNNWSKHWPKCKERNQSPINIQHDQATLAFLRPITFKGLRTALKNIPLMNLFRFGRLDFSSVQPRVTAEGGALPAHSKYYLVSANLRVGRNKTFGSQMSIDGKRGAFELVLVFGSDSHATSGTLRKVGSVVAISFKGKVGRKDNPGWTPIVNGFRKIIKGGSQTTINLPSLRSLLPRKPWSPNYYTFVGSVSFPPCSEGIIRVLYERHIYISAKQWAALKGIQDENKKPIVNNFRHQKPSIHIQIFRSHLDRMPKRTSLPLIPKTRRTTTKVPNVVTEDPYGDEYKPAPTKKPTRRPTTQKPKPNIVDEYAGHQ